MGGGLIQLIAIGPQDVYLTGNPQITFFKIVYKQYTNFSKECIELEFDKTPKLNELHSCTISRNGDLIQEMYLNIKGIFDISGTLTKTNYPIYGKYDITNIIEYVEIEIGGQKIDKHSGLWMEVWAELTEPNPTGVTGTAGDLGLDGGTLFQKMSGMGGVRAAAFATPGNYGRLFVPLQFWFCRNPGLALPLIALQYHEVKVILNHNAGANFNEDGASTPTNSLVCDYIYLDTDERRRFAQVSHEYLIEQVQEDSLTNGTGDLNFNHPVKELVWCRSGKIASGATGTSTAIGTSGTGKYILKLNGHDRFSARDWRYFSRVQVWEHHSGAGGLACDTADDDFGEVGKFDDSIGVYSFALKPEEHQPSGTCNFSRIDNARLEASGVAGPDIDKIFAVNYNVLRIMSGMGGLAYSN